MDVVINTYNMYFSVLQQLLLIIFSLHHATGSQSGTVIALGVLVAVLLLIVIALLVITGIAFRRRRVKKDTPGTVHTHLIRLEL